MLTKTERVQFIVENLTALAQSLKFLAHARLVPEREDATSLTQASAVLQRLLAEGVDELRSEGVEPSELIRAALASA